MFWITCLCEIIYNIAACVQNIRRLPLTHDLRRARHFVNGCVIDALLQCCAKHVAGTVAIYCADMMSNDVISTQKRQ